MPLRRGDSLNARRKIEEARQELDRLTIDLVRLVARRDEIVLRIGKFKAEQGLQVDDPEREAQVLEAGRKASVEMGVDPNVIEAVLKLLIAHGRKLQREALSGRGASHPC